MEMREYLDVLKEQIRFEKARDMVEEEVKGHMEDQMEAYLAQGMSEAEAEAMAVRQMGDPVEAGVALDRIHRPRMDWRLVGLIALLSLAGLVVQYFWSAQNADFSVFWRQCVFIGLGLIVMAVVCLLDYSVVGTYAIPLWCGLSVLILFAALFGQTVNGARYFINVGQFRLEIRNYIYLYVPIYAGILYRFRGGGYLALVKCGLFHTGAMLVSLMAVTLPVCLDVTVICLILTIAAIKKQWFRVTPKYAYGGLGVSVLLVPGLLMVFGLLRMAPYQIRRLQVILNPMRDPGGAGYTPSVIREAFQNGVWLGSSDQTLEGWIGGLNTDYVLIQLISSYGYLAAALLLVVFAVFLFHIFHTITRQKNQLGLMIGMGCGLVFAFQVFHGVMLNLGIGFMTVGIPFVSYGQSVAMVAYLFVGLLLGIYRYKDIPVKPKAPALTVMKEY